MQTKDVVEVGNGLFLIWFISETFYANKYSKTKTKPVMRKKKHRLASFLEYLSSKIKRFLFPRSSEADEDDEEEEGLDSSVNRLVLSFLSWGCCNFVFWSLQSHWASVALNSSLITAQIGIVEGLLGVLGRSSVVVAVVATSVLVGRLAWWKTQDTHHGTWSSHMHQDCFYISLVSLLCIAVLELGFDQNYLHTEVVKVTVLLGFSVVVLYMDARRYSPRFTMQDFLLAIGNALWYALLALPLAAVAISCVFLVITSAMKKLGGDPERSPLVNAAVYYGVLYGPLYVVYWHCKKHLIKLASRPTLPWKNAYT